MVTKRTINELLDEFMDDKCIDGGSKKTIKKNLYKDMKKAEEGDDVEEKGTKVSHGTSCPRVMTKTGELIIEL